MKTFEPICGLGRGVHIIFYIVTVGFSAHISRLRGGDLGWILSDLWLTPFTVNRYHILLLLESTWSDFCTDSCSESSISCGSPNVCNTVEHDQFINVLL